MTTNIGYWEKILRNPSLAYARLFAAEKDYLTSHIQKESSVIDIGCGDGSTIQTILPIVKTAVGIDNDPKAIVDAKVKLLPSPVVSIMFADALALPFGDKSFDVVIHMATLVNFGDNKIQVLKEMRRVIKDDGKIILSVYSEEALPARLEMYKHIGLPIKKEEGTKLIFDESVGANESEQFSKGELEALIQEADLKITDYIKVEGIAYICELTKK